MRIPESTALIYLKRTDKLQAISQVLEDRTQRETSLHLKLEVGRSANRQILPQSAILQAKISKLNQAAGRVSRI